MLIAVNQILLTPCILLHVSFYIVLALTTITNLLLVVLSFFIKDNTTSVCVKKEDYITKIMCTIVAITIVMTTIMNKSNADDSFYVSLSTTNIDSSSIYMEEPSMGYVSDECTFFPTEQIPTYELQIAILSKVFDINPAIICHSLLPMIIIFISYLAFYIFAKEFFNSRDSKIFTIILSIIFLVTGLSIRFRPALLLMRTWQGKAIFLNIGLTMIIISLIRIDKKINKTNCVLLSISNIVSIALSSTAIFLIPFTYLAFGVLKLIKFKWKDILCLIISFIPVTIYIAIYFLLNKFSNGGFIPPTDNVNIIIFINENVNKVYLIYYIISVILIAFLGTKKAKRYFLYVQIIYLFTIWNPLFSNIIAKYFTSSATFWRVLWLAPFEFTISYCTVKILQKFENIKIKMLVTMTIIIILILPGKFIYKDMYITENLENIPQKILDQTNYILEKNTDKQQIVVLAPPEPLHSTYMRQINSKIKLILSRDTYIGRVKDETEREERLNLEKIYYGEYIYSSEKFNELVEKYKIDWVIVENKNNELKNYIELTNLKKSCEMDEYSLYSNNLTL